MTIATNLLWYKFVIMITTINNRKRNNAGIDAVVLSPKDKIQIDPETLSDEPLAPVPDGIDDDSLPE